MSKAPPKCPNKAEHPLLELVERALGNLAISYGVAQDGHLCVVVPPSNIREVASKLKEAGFDHVLSISAIDFPQESKFVLVYIFASYAAHKGHLLDVRTEIPRNDPQIDTIHDIYPSADYDERECHEMFGVIFKGNPNMGKRFLLDEDCCIDEKTGEKLYPLRKDFVVPDWGIMG